MGGGHDHCVRVPQDLPVDPDLTHCGNGSALRRRPGIDNDVHVGGQSQVEHGRIGVESPLLSDERLELCTIQSGVGERFIVGLDAERLPVGDEAVLVQARDVVVVTGREVGEVLLDVTGIDDADVVAGSRRFDVGDPAAVGLGDQVGCRGLRCRIGVGDASIGTPQEVRPDMRQRLLLNVCDGAVVLPHRIQDVGRGTSAFEALDGCAMRVVGECLPGRSIVLEENIPEGPPVTAGLDDRNRIALESGDDLPVALSAATGDDGVDVLGEAGCRGGHVLMAEHDDDVGLTIGGVTVLELGGAGVGRGHRGGDCQGRPVRRGRPGGKVVGHHADEADAHPVDLLDEDPPTTPLGTQGIGAGHVRRQDGEVGGGQDSVLEVLHSAVERVDPQG